MIKKRTIKYTSCKPKNIPIDEESDESITEIRKALKLLQQLKKPCRGLAFTSHNDIKNQCYTSLTETSQENLKDASFGTPSYKLLDKSFHTQAAPSDCTVDKDLEKFLEEKLESLKKKSTQNKEETDSLCELRKTEESLENNLYELPEHLKVLDASHEDKNKMTWSTGLVEVPLPLDVKLQALEEIEKLKYKELCLQGIKKKNHGQS